MTFCSVTFVAFAAVFFAGWSVVRRFAPLELVWWYLVCASLVFYGWRDVADVPIFVAILAASYACGRLARRTRHRRLVLALAIACALGPLVVIKYGAFIVAQAAALAGHFGFELLVPAPKLALPLGISFYSISAVAYAIDVYTEEIEPETRLGRHFVYLGMFPIVMAGPMVRGGHILPQLAQRPATTPAQRWLALKRITYGLVKKCIVADHIGNFLDQLFNFPVAPPSSALWWCVAVLYLVQQYCDFSGYIDIALGLGSWIGIELPEGFDRPLLATSLRDFWTRWNMTFIAWLRDYIYYPLARRWPNPVGAVAAVLITFEVSGVWHGVGWLFMLWGGAHGLALCIEHGTKWDHRVAKLPGGRVIATVVVVLFVAVLELLTRANDLDQARQIFTVMFSFATMPVTWLTRSHASFHEPLWVIYPVLFILIEARHLVRFDTLPWVVAIRERVRLGWLAIALLLLASVYLRGPHTAFIYAGY